MHIRIGEEPTDEQNKLVAENIANGNINLK